MTNISKINRASTIDVQVIADSINNNDNRITTFQLRYPRFIHSEFMTHRMFSRNASSSRAIPIERVIENVKHNPAIPLAWGKNRAGMQSTETLTGNDANKADTTWTTAAMSAANYANNMMEIGVHKQFSNRLLEPFQFIHVVCSATEYDNFFNLRIHKDAQPEIRKLATMMHQAREASTPEKLHSGEWHTPYVAHTRQKDGTLTYGDNGEFGNNHELALQVSASCCAQISYRNMDTSMDKAKKIFRHLIDAQPMHASPIEHQATPMANTHINTVAEIGNPDNKGATHADAKGNLWSGNYKGFIQYRQLFDGHTCHAYTQNY